MTNEVLEAIRTRRSIRRYKPEQITEEQLDAVLQAGAYAPSGMGRQPVYLVAVQQPELHRKLAKMNAAVMGTGNDPYYGAPTIIFALADANSGTWVEDASCAVENMALAAHSLGLAACWIYRERQMFESGEGRALLKEWGLPADIAGVGALALGYSAESRTLQAAPRKPGHILKF